MTIFITKYALNVGIEEAEGYTLPSAPSMVKITGGKYEGKMFYGEGKEWHKTFDRAQSRAMDMQKKKIKSLRAQLKRVKALNFGDKASLTKNAINTDHDPF